MPLVVIWCFVALALGTLAGICGYYLASGFTALLAVIATAIILFAVVFPQLPALIRRTKAVAAALKHKPGEGEHAETDGTSDKKRE